MPMSPDIETRMLDVAQTYGRYKPNAYRFTYDAVRHTADRSYRATRVMRHVSGREVLDTIREVALERFGFMAKTVFEQWGVRATEDFGEIVFHLIQEGLLSKDESDRPSDFACGYDFDEVFVRSFDWLEQFSQRRVVQP